MAISTKRDVEKKFTVTASGLSRFAKTDTLAEAKRAGLAIAKKEAWRGKWNLLFIALTIAQRRGDPGSAWYNPTGWIMYVPVRGSGASAERILSEIHRRHKVPPFKWTRKQV